LTPKIRGEGCGEHLQLSSMLDLEEFRADGDGDLEAVDPSLSSLEDLELCGPSLAAPCPLLLPGYAVSEDGRFRCTARSAQRGCTLEVDLSVCGLGHTTGEISPDGGYVGTIDLAATASRSAATTVHSAPTAASRSSAASAASSRAT
jgi:hypothetical protein